MLQSVWSQNLDAITVVYLTDGDLQAATFRRQNTDGNSHRRQLIDQREAKLNHKVMDCVAASLIDDNK